MIARVKGKIVGYKPPKVTGRDLITGEPILSGGVEGKISYQVLRKKKHSQMCFIIEELHGMNKVYMIKL